MRIVLDSNVIIPEYNLDGSRTRLLVRSLPSTSHTLFVPEVVVDEIVGKVSRNLRKLRGDIQEKLATQAARQLPVPHFPLFRVPSESQILSATDAYRETLVRKLRDAGAQFLDYPNVPHARIVQRLARQQRPFLPNKDGEGYRDTLVWETVIELARQGSEPIAFVSADAAFREGDTLHPDLQADLRFRGIDPERVVLCADFNRFVEAYLTVTVELEAIREKLMTHSYDALSLEEVVRARLLEQLRGWEFDLGLWGAHTMSAIISHVSDVRNVWIDKIIKMSSGEILVRLQAEAVCLMDLEWRDGVRHDPWEVEGPVTVTLSLTFDGNGDSITSSEVVSVTYPPNWNPTPTSTRSSEVASRMHFEQKYQRLRQFVVDTLQQHGAQTVVTELVFETYISDQKDVVIGGWRNRRVAVWPQITSGGTEAESKYMMDRLVHLAGYFSSFIRVSNVDEGIIVSDSERQQEALAGKVRIMGISNFPNYVRAIAPSDE